ncbi:MAG: hypothetical protein HYY14_04930 [Candidatus Omnitrophica bacterium]|nr:hypothetical protein [Candidatus Omnitrophota bacterium]
MFSVNKFLATRSKKERAGIYLAALFVFLAGADRLVLDPFLAKMGQIDAAIEEHKALIKRNSLILANQDNFKAEIELYKKFIIESVSEEEEIASLLKEVEGVANQSSVYVVDIKSKGVTREGPTERYLVDLNCEGEMEHLVRFMYLVENTESLLKISKYTIMPRAKESSILKATISIYKLRTQSEEEAASA